MSDEHDALEVAGEAQVVPVDPPDQPKTIYATVTASRLADKRPVIPAWLRNRRERRQLVTWALDRIWHLVRFHAVRSPGYAARLVIYAPRGGWRVTRRAIDAVTDAESRPLRTHLADKKDHDNYLKLVKQRDRRVRTRGVPLLALLLVVIVLAVVVTAAAPAAVQFLALAAVVAVFGWIGAPQDRPVVSSAVVGSGAAPKLTSEVVVRGLRATGIAALTAKGAEITFVDPIQRDGPGWLAVLDLPFGVTATDILEARTKLSSGLRRPVGCVWPEPAHHVHAGRLRLWVGEQDMSQAKQPPWPLLKGQADLFKPIPFGTDQRGRNVSLELFESNGLIGAMPGSGKTFALRTLLLGAALDPHAELDVFELKGTGDLACFEAVAQHYASGQSDATVEAALIRLRELRAECERRAEVISKLPRDLCPENKITPALARRRNLGLHLIVASVDECQALFSHPIYGKEAGTLAEQIIRLGRALGIILWLATQRPDADSLPKGISANAGIRFCLRVMGHTETDMILGSSMYKNGVRPTTLTARDKGIGYLVGASDDPQVVRAYYLDGPAAERVCQRARALRETAGTLAGYAAGEQQRAAAVDLLVDLRTVFATAHVDRVWSERLCELLAELRPAVYGGWSPPALAAALRPHGIAPGQVWADGQNRNGYQLVHVGEALARRELAG